VTRFEEISDDIFSDVQSFSFSILEKSKSMCKFADNLLKRIDLSDDVNEFEENDERN
jgi:hypothetical protein